MDLAAASGSLGRDESVHLRRPRPRTCRVGRCLGPCRPGRAPGRFRRRRCRCRQVPHHRGNRHRSASPAGRRTGRNLRVQYGRALPTVRGADRIAALGGGVRAAHDRRNGGGPGWPAGADTDDRRCAPLRRAAPGTAVHPAVVPGQHRRVPGRRTGPTVGAGARGHALGRRDRSAIPQVPGRADGGGAHPRARDAADHAPGSIRRHGQHGRPAVPAGPVFAGSTWRD